MTNREQEAAKVYQRYKVNLENVNAWFETKQALKNISLSIKEKTISSFIGPSGCGKTTLLRCLNRMHEMTPGALVTGEVLVDGVNIYDKSIDPAIIRQCIGMVFQKPNPFPTMSIFNNVASGLKLSGIRDRKLISEVVEEALRGAVLWDEVKNELGKPGMSLSVGSSSDYLLLELLRCNQK
jgi:phosphate transport system ATP-binding protein